VVPDGRGPVSCPVDPAVALLRAAIAASGLSARRYATEVLTRDERTVRRWLAGKSPIPRAVVAMLTGQHGLAPRVAAEIAGVADYPPPLSTRPESQVSGRHST